MLENTEGVIKKNNPEKLATLGTQDTGKINVREYRRGNKKGQSETTLGAQEEDKRKKTQHNMCWTLLCASRHTHYVSKTCVLLQTTGGKDEPSMVFCFLTKS